ncbi:signal peptidase II [Ammoniphilus sp. CFH 90114]|uniref:signal peptidase II n=1 Tax=Ammoniphilus sp. CFH 90114 TaxID=2493665 RepID=UPI00100F3BDB|nr:signal peptidase II [Ammoniphilus sp. CFH 90114]RXT15510.1 lipoprotein signal peptidase [Ammoniphilus sp. CFH 90114]
MLYYIIALIVFALDQLTKWIVVKNMELGQSIPLLEGVFHFTSHRNRGAAFGILQDQRWFFIVITLFVMGGIIYYLRSLGKDKPMFSYALALILGGAVGNFLDRLLFGEVVDFLDFTLINFPIFNIADSAIVIGVGLMIWDTILEMKRERRG